MPPKKIHDVEVFMISPDGQKLPIRIKELEDLTILTEVTEKMEEWNFRHVVYCKDCKYYNTYYQGTERNPVITHLCQWFLDRTMEPDDYCS